MKDYTKLINELRGDASNSRDVFIADALSDMKDALDTYIEAAEFWKAKAFSKEARQKDSLWFRTEDRLPPDNVKVLCMGARGGIFLGSCCHLYGPGSRLGDPSKVEWFAYGRYDPQVIMWHPLPLRPEGIS